MMRRALLNPGAPPSPSHLLLGGLTRSTRRSSACPLLCIAPLCCINRETLMRKGPAAAAKLRQTPLRLHTRAYTRVIVFATAPRIRQVWLFDINSLGHSVAHFGSSLGEERAS